MGAGTFSPASPVRAAGIALFVAVTVAGAAGACAGMAQGPSMRDMFRGIPTDRCKDLGGPPPSDATGPHVDSIDVKEGRPGTAVVLAGTGFDQDRKDEVRFLLAGKDAVAAAEPVGPGRIRVRVPDMGVRGKPERGWVFVVRKTGGKELWGKAASFLFLPPDVPTGFPGPAPAGRTPGK